MSRQITKKLKPKDQIKLWNIAVGDSVRVISGPSKGRVGKVQECLKDQNKIIVSGVNIIKKMLPKFLSESAGLETQKFEYAAPIHYSNVQLVGDIPQANNPSGPKRTVNISRVHRGKLFYNKDKKLLTWRRWVPGENVFLPWPRNEREKRKGVMDTPESEVASNTYLETLYRAPIPLEVQHELRNKYSKFRRGQQPYEAAVSAQAQPKVVEVRDVSGIEAVSDHDIRGSGSDGTAVRTRRGGSDERGPLKGMSPETINLLAEVMSKTSLDASKPTA